MSILNKRNAVLGWSVWKVSKIAAKQKAKQAVQPEDKGRNRGKIISVLARPAAPSGSGAAGAAMTVSRPRS